METHMGPLNTLPEGWYFWSHYDGAECKIWCGRDYKALILEVWYEESSSSAIPIQISAVVTSGGATKVIVQVRQASGLNVYLWINETGAYRRLNWWMPSRLCRSHRIGGRGI